MSEQTAQRQYSIGWIMLLALLTALGPLSIDMYLPALPQMAHDFGVSTQMVANTLPAYFFGLAIGQLVYGPLSDRIGRKKPLYFGLALYAVASLFCVLATNEWSLIAARILQALGGCVGVVMARAAIRDRLDVQGSAQAFSSMMIVMGLAPILAPMIGAWILIWFPWQAIFIALSIVGAICWLFLGSFGFSGERMDTPCESFSGGERARLALALIVWQRPNVLILDEPTNHLDLDMRHALSMALQDFEGAVVLVSHERQLIASVCDELLLVHGGKCTEFEGDLQDYAKWLREARQQQINAQTAVAQNNSSSAAPAPAKVDKEAQRKEAARRREQTRPIRKNIEKVESQIEKLQPRLAEIEEALADTSLYEANRKDDLLKLMNEQTELKAKLEQNEEQLLELMMELEEMEASFEN
ncbi:MFS transporter [Acinetobacter baumannii]